MVFALDMCMGMGFPFPWDSRRNPMCRNHIGMGTRICKKMRMGMGRVHVTMGMATFYVCQNSHWLTRRECNV